MTVVIDVTDFTVLDTADAQTNWQNTNTGQMAQRSLNTDNQVEGTGCMQYQIQQGVGNVVANHGSTDMTDTHIFFWFRPAQAINTFANGGGRIRVGTDTIAVVNYGEWNVMGSDKALVVYNGWVRMVVDILKPFTVTAGTPPAITAIVASGGRWDFTAGSENQLGVIDQIAYGNTMIVRGGTNVDPGVFAEIGILDESGGNGYFKLNAGVFFCDCDLEIGDTGTGSSYLRESNQVLVFEDLPVSASLYKIRHVANATGTNEVTFGTSSGTGTAKEGSGGITVKAAGAVPFRIEVIDTNIDVAQYFGCSLIGPSVLFDDAMRNFKMEDNSLATFVDDTRDANDAGAADTPAMPATQALNDACYFGHNERFYELNIDLGTAKGGAWAGTWEYYNGTAWAALTDVTDGTANFATVAPQVVTYSIPDDWAKVTVDTDSRYWIRFRISSFTSSGTVPNIDEASLAMAGDIRWEDPAAEAIRCVFTKMGSIRVRNGAFLKKSVITDSIVPAKHGALDLGGADPAADTVRDLTIQNCSKGILLKGSGNVTYSFRNIKFSGNTQDVRVDFGSGDTVTINISEGGDTPTIDNVNGSTVVVSNPVTALIHATDNLGVNLQNARVYLVASDGTGDLPFEDSVTITRSGTVATVAHTAHGLVTGDKVKILGITDKTEDNAGIHSVTVTTANAYTYTTTNSGSTSYTGTIISTGVSIEGLTDINGDISASRTYTLSQPVKGFIRKSTVSPRFKTFSLAGNTISNSAGLTVNARMILDE